MQYFTEDFIQFMAGLAINNDKSWMDANRETYHKEVKDKFAVFLEDLITEIRKFDEIEDLPLNKFSFRINRDIRFSKDKTPYNPWCSASLVRGGKKDNWPGYYIRLGVEGVDIGGGFYHPDKEQVTAIRRHISENGDELHKLLKKTRFKKYFGELKGEKNKIVPKEFKQAAIEEPFIANKSWNYWVHYPLDTIVRDDLLEFVLDHYKSSKTINAYLKEALQK